MKHKKIPFSSENPILGTATDGALGAIRASLSHMDGLRADLVAAKAALPGVVVGLRQQFPDEDRLWPVLLELYWTCNDLPVSSLAAVLGVNTGAFTDRVRREGVYVWLCEFCGEEYAVRSRSDRDTRHFRRICPACQRQQESGRQEEWRQQRNERQQWLRKAHSMPYAEYLRTGHWLAFAEKARRHAHYACQLCNYDEMPLHVHHRTYARLGEEQYSDVTVLCSACHTRFHEGGNMPVREGDDE